jgi:hypothetical protein
MFKIVSNIIKGGLSSDKYLCAEPSSKQQLENFGLGPEYSREHSHGRGGRASQEPPASNPSEEPPARVSLDKGRVSTPAKENFGLGPEYERTQIVQPVDMLKTMSTRI